MPRGFFETSAYIQTDKTPELVEQLIGLCKQAGMKRVEHLASGPQREADSACWAVAVFPGIQGWSLIKALPVNALCQPTSSVQLPFVELCTRLKAPGCLLSVHDASPWGEVMLETDGRGQTRLSGWWYDDLQPQGHHFYGLPLEAASVQHRFDYLPELKALLESCRYEDLLPMDIFCKAVADRLGGSYADLTSAWEHDPWAVMSEHRPSSDWALLSFESEDLNQAANPAAEAVRTALATGSAQAQATTFLYASGASVQVGDAVLMDPNQTPASVVGFMQVSKSDGSSYVVGVRVKDRKGEFIVWAHAVPSQLRLLARFGP